MKAISTIIATILILMITITLAGTSYLFISGTLTSKTATAFEIVDSYDDTVIIRNIGTEPITSFRSAKLDNDDAIYHVSTQDNSLVGNWKFDELDRTTATDSSGKGNTGTFSGETWNDGTINGATFTDGQYGNALSFDGTDDYVNVPDSDAFNLGSFTLEAWIKTSNAGSSRRRIVSQQDGGNYWLMALGNNVLELGFYCGGTEFLITKGVALNDNAWKHVTVVRDLATNQARWYVNGAEIGSQSLTGYCTSTIAVSNAVNIGRYSGGSEYFNGLIDEVRIYNRALTQAEIQADMNSPYPVNRTVAWYNFENDAKDRHNIVKGKAGTALSFDGVDDYVNAGNGASLGITNTITIEAWVKPNTDTGHGRIVEKGWAGEGSYMLMKDTGTSGKWYFGLVLDGAGRSVLSDSSYEQDIGAWTHLVGWYDGTTIKLFKNGVQQASTLTYSKSFGTTSNLIISASFIDGFNGIMDEVKIYNKALSEQEIKSSYNIGSQINAGETATIKIYNQLSKGMHTLRLCTSSMCNTGYLTIQ